MMTWKIYLQWAVVLILGLALTGCEEDEAPASYLKPLVMDVSPGEGIRGTVVTLSGENLDQLAGVKFGGQNVNFQTTEDGITVVVPAELEEGETIITVYYAGAVSTNLGPSASVPFKVLYEPLVTSVDPPQAKPTYEITLSGNYLRGAFLVMFDTLITPFEASQTNITATVPDLAPGLIDITVGTPGGETTIPFEVLAKTPEIFGFDPEAGGRPGEQVVILGQFFIDVQKVLIGTKEVEEFEVLSESQIQITIPEGVSRNKVTVVTSIGEVTSEDDLSVVEIPFVLFSEGLHGDMQNWGWGGSDDFNNTEVARTGSVSYLRTYNEAWSGIQLHHGVLNLSPYTSVEFSVYGGPGTTGKILNMNINWGPAFEVNLTEGEWVDFTVPLADLGNPGILNELIFQENGGTDPQVPFTVYLDEIRFIE